ncbi:hypothetical protein GCM10023238_12740 [Streptomyces heliomycini]
MAKDDPEAQTSTIPSNVRATPPRKRRAAAVRVDQLLAPNYKNTYTHLADKKRAHHP